MNLSQALIDELVELKQKNKLIIFVGSGVSKDSGLPTWSEFVDSFITLCEKLYSTFIQLQNSEIKRNNVAVEYTDEIINDLKRVIDITQKDKVSHPMEVLSVLRDKIEELKAKTSYKQIDDELHKIVFSGFFNKTPNKLHKHIILSNFPCIITTNYDTLLEEAADELNKIEYKTNSFSFKSPEEIASKLYTKEPLIIHLHGVLNYSGTQLNDLIIDSKDYQKIRKTNPATSFILRSLFLDYSIMFVGFGKNDPHINDVMEEMSYYFPGGLDSKLMPQYYIFTNSISEIVSERGKKIRTKFIKIDYSKDFDTIFAALK